MTRFFHIRTPGSPATHLSASAQVPQVQEAVNDLIKDFPKDAVIIGAVAFAFYARPVTPRMLTCCF